MRLAILSDIHGNLRGLEACLSDLGEQGGADIIAGAGDYCLDGPQPAEVVDRLIAVGALCVRGNTDRMLADVATEFEDEDERELRWFRERLGEARLRWLRALPFARSFGDGADGLLIVHANPKTDDEHIWPGASDDFLERITSGVSERTIAFGHLHLPYVRVWRDRVFVDVASAGLPKDGDPRAGYALLTQRSGGWEVKHRRVAFDVERVARDLSKSGMPGAARHVKVLRRHRYKQLDLAIRSAAPALRVDKLSKRYATFTAVDEVSLVVERGDFFGFLGPNGAGKTTTINAIVGLATITSGTIEIFGYDNVRSWREARALVGLAPQEYNFDRYLSIRDVLIYQAGYFGLRGRAVRDRADALLESFDLTSKANDTFVKLSGGMKRRLTLARAMIHEPELLILDEPTAGVDVELRIELWSLLRKLNAAGTTIILTTHYLEEAESLYKNIAIIEAGRIVAMESTAKLLARNGAATLTVTVAAPADGVPASLAAYGGLFDAPSRTFVFEGIAPPLIANALAELQRHGYTIENVDFTRSTLQDVFLDLVGRT